LFFPEYSLAICKHPVVTDIKKTNTKKKKKETKGREISKKNKVIWSKENEEMLFE